MTTTTRNENDREQAMDGELSELELEQVAGGFTPVPIPRTADTAFTPVPIPKTPMTGNLAFTPVPIPRTPELAPALLTTTR